MMLTFNEQKDVFLFYHAIAGFEWVKAGN